MSPGPEFASHPEIISDQDKLKRIKEEIENSEWDLRQEIVTIVSLREADAIAARILQGQKAIADDVIDIASTICGYAMKHKFGAKIEIGSLWELAMKAKSEQTT